MVWIIMVLLVVADQATKIAVRQVWQIGEGVDVLGSFFRLVHVENEGAAFSMLADRKWGIWVLVAVSVIVSISLLVMLFRLKNKVNRIIIAIVAAGSIGNLIDRAMYQKVTDFILLSAGGYSFPCFNVADICITIGFGLLALRLIFDRHSSEDFGV